MTRGSGDSPRPAEAAGATPRRIGARDVVQYLRRHPDFFVDHPDLLADLRMPGRPDGPGVVDLQQVLLRRQREDINHLRRCQSELVQLSRSNMANQGRIHAAVLALLEATSLEHLIETVTTDLSVVLDVDVVTLCVEAGDFDPAAARQAGLLLLPSGAVDQALGGRRDIRLIADQPGPPALFGEAATLVHSQALVRLEVSDQAPLGLLAFGAREADAFTPSQGTELLAFLGRALESMIRRWLIHLV